CMAPELEQLSPCTSNGNDSNEHSNDEATSEILPDILYEPHNFRHYTPTLYLGKVR
ncbi:unnamed protein product, partial [Onchocerca ochengi]|uniref:Pecanex-like protein n=1 Tax=Onchocerca ochengi TaxID=42157 RepID=A0A182EYI8_ONCOC